MEAKILSQYWGRPVNDSTISKLDEESKRNLALYARAVATSMNINRTDCSELLKLTLDAFQFSLDSEVFNKMDSQDAFEIWSLDGRFVASSNQFYSLTSWTIDDLLTRNRAELFTKDDNIQSKINEALGKVIATGKMIEAPVKPHVVHERKVASRSVVVTTRAFAPVFNAATKTVSGVIAIVRFSQPLQ